MGWQIFRLAAVLSVEILSPSTALKDRNTKLAWYQQQKVQYYLLINTETGLVEIFELVNDEFIALPHNGNFTFQFSEGCRASGDFTQVWDGYFLSKTLKPSFWVAAQVDATAFAVGLRAEISFSEELCILPTG